MCLKATVNQAYVGDLGTSRRIANRGLAAPRIPAQKASVAQRQARKHFLAIRELNMLGKGSHDLSSAALIHDSWTAKKPCISLAVSTVANDPRSGRGGDDEALKRAAATPEWVVHQTKTTAGV